MKSHREISLILHQLVCMLNLRERFLRIINDLLPDAQERRFLVAVSGGVDSMVLASLMHESNLTYAVAHCNFNLRGKESDADQALVQSFTERIGVICHVERFKTLEYAKQNSMSIQMAARELRYTWFQKLLNEEGFDFLVVAHHANDNLETALFNISKGTGVAGVRGIMPLREKVVRPLLTFSKNALVRYAEENKINWREDKSNENDNYNRNLIRNHVVPQLEKVNPNLVQTFVQTSKRFLGLEHIIENQLEAFQNKFSFKGVFQLPFSESVKGVNHDLFKEMLLRKGFEFNALESFLKSNVELSGAFIKSDNLILWRERNGWLLQEKVIENTGSIYLEKQSQSVSIGNKLLVTNLVENVSMKKAKDDLNAIYLDMDKWDFPLELRAWQIGDRMQPFGMKGTKLVSDILIDKKVPPHSKAEQLVLIANGEILAVLGLKTSEKLRFNGQIDHALKIILKP